MSWESNSEKNKHYNLYSGQNIPKKIPDTFALMTFSYANTQNSNAIFIDITHTVMLHKHLCCLKQFFYVLGVIIIIIIMNIISYIVDKLFISQTYAKPQNSNAMLMLQILYFVGWVKNSLHTIYCKYQVCNEAMLLVK